MSRLADAYARISPRLAHRPGSAAFSRTHALLLRLTRGRVGRRFMGGDVLVLRTVGRRSGKPREAPMFYVPYRDGYAVVASNAASERPPAWWLNLQARPEAEATVGDGWRPVRAREASPAERDELWPLFVDMYRGYDHYKEIARREMPVVVLEPRA
jgi:deazaflavin-dependent oxidoreductase (nitroreductase family)